MEFWQVTVFTCGIEQSDCKLACLLLLHCKNKLDIAVVARPFVTFYISSASYWIFLSWTGYIFFQESVKQRSAIFIIHYQCSLISGSLYY